MSEFSGIPANFNDARAYYESLSHDDLIARMIAKDALLRVALHRSNEAEKDRDHDVLTGLFNRRGLQEQYEKRKHDRRKIDALKPDFVAVIDLDDFKKINDSKGHDGGDESLIQVANFLQLSLRSDDIIGRHGGDEFVAFLFSTSVEHAQHIVGRMRANRIAATNADPSVLIPTLSIGLAEVDYSLSYGQVIKNADQAMYQAKQAGKDQAHMLNSEFF